MIKKYLNFRTVHKAGLLLAEQKNYEANEIFGNIIMSKNKFYSILALNAIIEKN